MKNPFIINGIVPDEYFCDRVHETDKLIKCIGNQTNVLLTSPRRMGKTQLVPKESSVILKIQINPAYVR